MKKTLSTAACILTVLGWAEDSAVARSHHRPMRVQARHIEGNGIGYNQGYTTLEGFFSPPTLWNEHWLPLLDVRMHLFNNGKPALNAGAGVRYLSSSRIWGANAYYDYRKTSRQHYNQVSIGFESLGRLWDFRLNGYLPVGCKQSHLFGDPSFDGFEGHYAYLRRKLEFAMKGVNAEAGIHVNKNKHTHLYFAGGPYFLEGRGRQAWGGQLRGAIDIDEYIRLEANVSYDNVFKWIGQGQISAILPFGKKRTVKSTSLILADRLVQNVDRFEIIPVDRMHKHTKAIDPQTGSPYYFLFVDNTSHSKGTYESPFHSLLDAQSASSPYDVIYVLPGDGTSKGMNESFIMQDGQKIWGAGTDQTLATPLGTLKIPREASVPPVITLGIQLGNHCEVIGVHIDGTQGCPAIYGEAIRDVLIQNNVITNCQVAGGLSAVTLQNCQGNLVIANNQISKTIDGGAIAVSDASVLVNATVQIQNNQIFSNANTVYTVSVNHGGPGTVSAVIQNNTIQQNNRDGIFIGYDSFTVPAFGALCGKVIGNTVTDNQFGFGLQVQTHFDVKVNVDVESNTFIGNEMGGVYLFSAGNEEAAKLLNNVSLNNAGNPGYIFECIDGILQVENLSQFSQFNQGSIEELGSVSTTSEVDCNCH